MKYKNFLILIAIIATASLTGCRTIRQTLELDDVVQSETPQSQPTTQEQRFSESDRSKVEEVANVRSMAQKNDTLKAMVIKLTNDKDDLTTENDRLIKRYEIMKDNLGQTEKELAEANDMLIEMRIELNKWKDNVLGFREEINFAHKEQIKALVKILKLMGAEYASQPENQATQPD
jgi:hypothetical protein